MADEQPRARLGIALREALPWADLVQIVRTAEDTGYEALFVPEIAGREAFATLAGLAGATERLKLGTGVVTIQARSPVVTAMASATLQELSGGRHVLGIGAGSPGAVGGWPGIWDRPLERTRAHVAVIREVHAGREVGPDGPGGAAGLSAPFRATLLPPTPPPIWLAALGDRMISLAGEIADGVLLNWCTPERVRAVRGLVEKAAADAGRDPRAVTVALYLRACLLGADDDAELRALREMTATYAAIPAYRAQFELMGLGPEADAAREALVAGRIDDVPETLVDALCVRGGRGEIEARRQAFADAGADLVVVYPVPALDPFSSMLSTVLTAAPSPAVER